MQERYRKTRSALYGREAQQLDGAMRAALFPAGVAAISQQPYVQEQVAVDNLLALAKSPELADARAALPELTAMFDHLAERNQEYGEVLFEDMSAPNAPPCARPTATASAAWRA